MSIQFHWTPRNALSQRQCREHGRLRSFTVYDARSWQRGADGAWRITNAPTAFAAQLEIEARGVGRGFANLDRNAGDPRRLHPSARLHADLGTMHRHGACWLSEESALCAWE